MSSEIKKASDTHDLKSSVAFVFIVIIMIYELSIAVTGSYFLFTYNIVQLNDETYCKKDLITFQMHCGFDYFTSILSCLFGLMCYCSGKKELEDLKTVVQWMFSPQSIQIIMACVYLRSFYNINDTCRNKLQMNAPGLWTIAIIHMIISYVFLIVIIVIIIACAICLIKIKQKNRSQTLELANKAKKEEKENIV